MNDLPPLRSDDEDNFSIGDLPMSKSKKITHSFKIYLYPKMWRIALSRRMMILKDPVMYIIMKIIKSFLVPKYDAKNIHS